MCTFRSNHRRSSSEEDEDSSENSDIEVTDSTSEFSEEDLDSSVNFSCNEEPDEEKVEKMEEEEDNDDDSDDDDDDELIKAIKLAKDKTKIHPSDINFEDVIMDISFHPGTNIIAIGSAEGDLFLYNYGNDSNKLINTLELHTRACRAVEFNNDGSKICTCGKDKSIMVTDTATGKLLKFYDDAHENPLYSLYIIDENIITTGDEEGIVKVWDVRLNHPVMTFKNMEDFVSDMITNEAKKFLICSSGDGTITSFNLPAKKMFVQSEGYDAELNSLQLLKHELKLLTCSSKGKMYLYNWGEFGYHSDEYSGTKESINSTIAITENIILAGYEDGNIRAINLFPHQQLGIVGQHDFSVEAMDISYDGKFIASISLDQKVKFWNIKYFEDLYVAKKKTNKKNSMIINLPSSKIKNSSDFFSDLK